MPRNASGTYSLPSGNPVVSGTIIESTWANSTLSDIANELTNSLSRNGDGGMLAPLRFADGTVGAPGFAFTNEPATGIYRVSSNVMGVSVAGTQIGTFTTNGFTLASGKTVTFDAAQTFTGSQVTGNISGNAANVTGTVAVANGGTGATAAPAARTNLGATTVGGNIFTLADPSAVTFLRVNADNTVSALDAATFRSAIGAGSGTGDVVGPASATNNAVALFNGTTGKLVKNSTLTFDGATLQTSSTTAFYPQFVQINKTNDTSAAYLVLDKDRNSAVVQNGDNVGNIVFRGYGGASYHQAAAILVSVDGAPGNNDMPGRFSILTTADGASAPTERVRISSTGTFTLYNDYVETVVTANTGTAYTINIANGTVQNLTLTGNCTFTFPTATAGKSFILLLKQDATGSRTVTWPATVKWPAATAPTITATAARLDKFVFTADGTNWYGSNGGQNYTV